MAATQAILRTEFDIKGSFRNTRQLEGFLTLKLDFNHRAHDPTKTLHSILNSFVWPCRAMWFESGFNIHELVGYELQSNKTTADGDLDTQRCSRSENRLHLLFVSSLCEDL